VIFFSAVSDDDDRDVERRGAHYVTPRFMLTVVGIVVVVLVLAYLFVIGPAIENGNFVKSQSRIKAIAQGMNLYAEANNDGLPPVYLIGEKDANGRPVTWANQVFDYVGRMEVFNSPALPGEGNTMLTRTLANGTREDVELSYGMLSAADTARRYEIHDDTIILAETIGMGVDGSYNPLPLGGADGFMIGYDNSNGMPNAESGFVTRLAFTSPGASPLGLTPIHSKGVVGIRADGSLVILSSAAEAFPVSKSAGAPSGQWAPY
jgi:hypothetical protein